MKILQINKFFYLKGGSEKYFFELRDLLKKNNHQVIDFSMKDKKNLPSPFSEYFIEPINLKSEGIIKNFKKALQIIWNKEAQKKLEILIQKEKPDIAHLHNIHHEISLSILPVLKKYKIPIVQTLHDYQIICPNYKLYCQGKICEKCKKHKYYQCFLNKCVQDSYLASLFATLENYFYWLFGIYKNIYPVRNILNFNINSNKGLISNEIDLFIAPSWFLKNKFIEFGIPENKIIYLPNFVKLCHSREGGNPFISNDKFKNKREIIKKNQNDENENSFLQENNYLLYFGRLSKEKGVDVLIKAMEFINPNIKLKIVGEGPEKENLKKMARLPRPGLGNLKIQFLGHKNQNELKEIIKNSLAVVVPSLWYENCPLSILEAFSFGKTVIASNLGGIPELVQPVRNSRKKENLTEQNINTKTKLQQDIKHISNGVEGGKTGFLFEPENAKDLAEKINLLFEDGKNKNKEGKDPYPRLREQIISMGKFAQEQIEKKYNPEIHYQKLMEIYRSLLSS
jgi:glycosyltransferase involved in cell wall biosynthesis